MTELVIFTMNYKNPYTGGIRFTNSLADYAKANYSRTTIIDFAQLPRLVRRFRLVTIIYFCYFLLRRRNCHIVVDHVLHFRLLPPLLLSKNKEKSYTILFYQRFYHLRHNLLIKFIEYFTEKYFLKNAGLIILPSLAAKKDVMNFGIREEIIQIVSPTVSIKGNGVIRTEFQGYLLFIGQVEPWKGLDVLIRALSLIKDIPFHLDVVGRYDAESRYFKYIQKLINQNGLESKVQFQGQKTRTDLKEIFKNADIFTFPSRSETFGIVLLEAMSFGLPIVATAIPSTVELIQDNKNGILCPVDDPKQMADGLKLLLTNPELRQRLAKNNLERSKTFPTEEEVAGQVFNAVKPRLGSNQ